MKHYRIISLILLLCLALGAAAPAAFAAEAPEVTAQAAAEPPEASAQPALEAPAITARSAIVIDLGTGEVIWEKNADEVRSPASLTKIMTGLLAVEATEEGREDMTATVTAGNDCQFGMDSSSSNASIVSGEQMLYRDFFYCAMVVSANEACNVLASEIGGSLGGFVSMMNQRAASLGCEHTQFADTNGLSHDNRTTARELSVILREALDHEDFMTAFCTFGHRLMCVVLAPLKRPLCARRSIPSPGVRVPMNGTDTISRSLGCPHSRKLSSSPLKA